VCCGILFTKIIFMHMMYSIYMAETFASGGKRNIIVWFRIWVWSRGLLGTLIVLWIAVKMLIYIGTSGHNLSPSQEPLSSWSHLSIYVKASWPMAASVVTSHLHCPLLMNPFLPDMTEVRPCCLPPLFLSEANASMQATCINQLPGRARVA
jgi:hypothetical protein